MASCTFFCEVGSGSAAFVVSVFDDGFFVAEENKSPSSSSLPDCVKISVVDAEVVAPFIETFGLSAVNFGGVVS